MKKYFKPYNIIRVLVCLIVLFLIVFPFPIIKTSRNK